MADTAGHNFQKKTFHKPTYCHHCSDLLWGLIGQGYICEGKFSAPLLNPQNFHHFSTAAHSFLHPQKFDQCSTPQSERKHTKTVTKVPKNEK